MKVKKAMVVLAAALAGLGLTACGGGSKSTADGLEKEGDEVTVIDTANDFSKLASRIEDVVTAQTDGIILVSADPSQLENQLQEAFDDAIAANDKISLITEQHIPAEQPINDAQDTVENLLLSNPEKGSITAIWCGWDEPAIGATQACMEAGRDEILVVGVDGNEQAVDLIKQGTNLKATVKQNFDGMTDIVLEQMKLLYSGQEIEKGDMYADATLITQENAE